MITSTSNARIKLLKSYQKKKKLRDEAGVYIVEGVRMLKEVPLEYLSELYVSETFYDGNKTLVNNISGNPIILTDAVYNHVSDTKTPQGVLLVVKRREYAFDDMLDECTDFSIILDGLQDPGNLGTIIRSAEAAGVNGIFLTEDCVDVYNPKTIRATMGSVYRIPICYVNNMENGIDKMKDRGITIYAADLNGNMDYDKEIYADKKAFLIGNEGNGISSILLNKADTCIKIPMKGHVESLNAAISATVLMFEAARQNRAL
ncbi:MAG: TrmH family RNA methyltransferase [Suipraeoptans sp.]